jgi:hypothetical protein
MAELQLPLTFLQGKHRKFSRVRRSTWKVLDESFHYRQWARKSIQETELSPSAAKSRRKATWEVNFPLSLLRSVLCTSSFFPLCHTEPNRRSEG